MKINSRFTKKAVSIIVSAAMLLSQGTAIHAEGGEGQVSAPVSYPYQFEMMQADGVGSLEDVGEPISLWGFKGGSFDTNYRNQLDSESQKIYDAILSAYSNGANSNTVTIDIIDETFNDVSVTSTLETDAQGEQYYQLSFDNSVFGWVDEQLTPAFLALVYDHPELPWLVNVAYTYGSSEIGLSENIAAEGTFTRDVTLGNISFTLKEVLSDSGTKSDMDNAVSTAKTAINADIENSTVRYDILKGIHDYLSDTITYNDTAADKNQTTYSEEQLRLYQTAYSAFYKCNGDTTEDNTTVCAGYAKGFKLLCDSYGIPCVYVSGFAGEEAHGWNYVQMEDNNWYAVDVTWDDQDKAEPYYDFFLAGADSVPENFEAISFSASHTSSGNWASAGYNFIYPALNADKYVCAPTVVTPLEASHVTLSSTTLTYNGSAQTPTILVKVGETILVEGTDYTVSMPYDRTNAGTKTIEITGIGNYSGTVVKTYTIAKKDLSETAVITLDKDSYIYTGAPVTPVVTAVKDGEKTLTEDTDYIVSMPHDITNAGTKTIAITGIGNYSGIVEKTYTIAQKDLSTAAVITLDKDSYEYTGEAVIPVVTVKDGENTLTEGTDYTVEVTDNTGAGTGTVTVTFTGNYTGTASKTFPITLTAEITKKKAKVTVAPTPIERAYNGSPQKLVTEGTAENGTMQYSINDGNSWTWTETVPEKTDGGEYKVYYRAKAVDNNFADSDFDETTDFVTVIIEKVTPQFVYTKNSPIYTGEEHELLTVNLLSDGCTVEYSFDRTNWSTDIPKGKEAGVYKVYYRIKGTNNYSDYSGNNFDVTIAKATPDTSTIPEPVASEITYGQTLSQSVLENGWKWTDETKLPSVGESCEAYYTVDDKNYDYSNVTGYDAERHAIVMPAIITVNKADVTVKADDKYIVVGAELPEATYTVDGLVEDDSLVTAPTIGYSGADNMTIGEYDIVVKGADAGDNYEVTHVNGKLYVGLCDHNGTTKQSYDTEYHWNYCTKCGQTDMEKEAHNGGTATCTKQAVCKDCNIPYGKAKGHSWNTEWSSNSTHHWHECGNADCPVTADSGKDGYGAHTFGEWTTVTAPTATAKGTEKHSCICGYEETRDVPPTGSSGGNGGPGIVDPGIRPPVSTTTTHIITGAPDWSPNPSRPATTTTTTTTTRPPEDDEEIDDDIYEEDDSAEPQIKGDNGKMGWDVIEDEILDAEEGGTVTVDMNGATEVPEDILEQIQGKDIDLVIELENGAVWTINGESVTDPSDIDLGVEFDADIPVNVINSVTGESDYITISIAHDGEFGFTAVLTVDMGDENEGLYANLYWYTDGGAEFICADKINSRGKADLTFTHASDYIIVIDEDNHGKRAEESADGDVDDEIVTDEDDDANPFTAVTISFTGVIVSAAAVMLTRKRRK